MKKYTVCFSGHRELPKNKLISISDMLEKEIEYLIKSGYCCFESGGALGFDLFAAEIVLKLKKKYPHINLILILPCKEQTKYWKKDDIKNMIILKTKQIK